MSVKNLSQYDAVIKSPFGGVGLLFRKNKIYALDFLYCEIPSDTFKSKVANSLVGQLKEFFQGNRSFFDFEADVTGTEFQKRVWDELRKIPLGQTKTYGEIAKKLNSSPRAVGNACRRNPIPILIPCHRVVAKNGLGGFAGATEGRTISIKQWLLNFEASQ